LLSAKEAAEYIRMTDAKLIRAIQTGDASALPLLYDRGLPVVWRYVYRQLDGDLHTTQDIVSETFVTAIRVVGNMDANAGPLCGWLLGIARNKLAHHRRNLGRRRRHEVLADASEVCSTDGGCEPVEQLVADEETAEIMRVLDQMTDDERLALEWMYLDDLPRREIAGRLGKTVKAVENLLYRARRSFRGLYCHTPSISERR